MTPEQDKAEAVAWRWRPVGGDVWVLWATEPKRGVNLHDDAEVEIEPLYTHPSSRDDVLEAAERALERMAVAVSWIQVPFVDETTPLNELQARVALCVADAARALSGQTEKQGGESDG